MSETDLFNQAEKLLGRFDFATQLAAQEKTHREQLRALLLSFVEVLDSFDRLFGALGETEDVTPEQARSCVKSSKLIARQLEQALRAAGVAPLVALHQLAEPGQHEIVGGVDTSECADGTIVQEVFRGYEWEGELLRKPRVLVARGADSTVQEE